MELLEEFENKKKLTKKSDSYVILINKHARK
jgi:hypothetical protein